jgi:hypothetical protein
MKNIMKSLIFGSLLLLTTMNVFSQLSITGVLLSSAVSFQKNISSLSEEIRFYEKKTFKYENSIANSERILKLSKENNNKEAERISSEAILTYQKTIADCKKHILLLKDRKRKNESALAAVKKTMDSGSSQTNEVNSVALKHTGHVSVINQKGEEYALNSAQNPGIKAGDVISTSSDGFADIDFLDGKGSLTIGPDSKIRMYREKDSTNVLEVLNGKIYSHVLKPDEYDNKLLDIKKCLDEDTLHLLVSKNDISLYDKYLMMMKARVQKKFEAHIRVSAALAIRGTQFTIKVINENSSELQLIEGKIEVFPSSNTESVTVYGGQSCLIRNGTRPQIIQSDTLNLDKWWQYEE